MVFHDLSKEIYEWLENQKFVKEETLTDWLLYHSSKRCPKIFYKTFTRNEESHTGADWEWWILKGSLYNYSAYRFLVQAKKLHSNRDNFSSISYGNKNGMQIDLLINTAQKRNAFPLYAYYTTTHPEISVQIDNFKCLDERLIRWCEHCINGVFLSPAKAIRQNVIEQPRKYINDTELINNSLGLSLLDGLYCNIPPNDDILEKLNKYFIKDISGNNVESKIFNESMLGIKFNKNNLPPYLLTIINRNGNDISWIEQEFSYDLDEINGIAILDFRDRN